MPFHNPFWAKKQNPIGYLTLGLYPYTAKTTGSQTQVGSSPNTIEITFANHDKDYWNGYKQAIPAYTYFTLGSTALDASNVPAVSNPDTPILPHNVETDQGSNQKMEWQAAFSSWDGHKVYDGTPLTNSGLTITDMFAEDKDTVWYSGANPVHIAFSIQKNEGTLTVTAAPTPDTPLTAGSFTIEYLTNDHSIDTTYINGYWSGGTYPYTVTVNGTQLSESSSVGPGGSNGWRKTARGYGLYYDLYYTGTYVIVITDANNNSITETVEYTGGVENSGGEDSN